MKSKINKLLLTCIFGLGILPVAFAEAQTSAGAQPASSAASQGATSLSSSPRNEGSRDQIPEIVVTAQRRAESLQDVPISVSAASAARLEAAGILTTQDLGMITPGLTVPQTGGFYQPHLRGVGTSSNGPGIENPVALYIDGVYIANPPSSLLALNSVDRIEVLKGPQGTLFGRNATGGLIQVVTRDPQATPSAEGSVSYGNYQDITSSLYATGGLANGLAADVALQYEHQTDGYGHNVFDGSDVGNLPHDFAGRTKFYFTPSSSTQIRLTLDYENRNSTRDIQHLGTQYPGTFNNPFFGGPYKLGGPYDVDNNQSFVSLLKAGGASLQFNQDFGAATLQSITAYRKASYAFSLDIDLTPANLVYAPEQAADQQLSQELQLSGKNEGKLKWTAGVYYYYAKDGWRPYVIGFGPSLLSPVPGVPATLRDSNNQITNSAATYGQATYEIAADTNLTLGGRYTHEEKTVDGTETFSVAGNPVSITPFPVPSAGIPTKIGFNRFNYRFAVDHKFTSDLMGYVSYSTGFKSGGYNLAVSTNQPYKPEDIKATEVGLKSELLDRRIRLNVSAFNYLYNNIQVGRYIDNNETITNGARAKIYGADLDAEVLVVHGLTLNGGFSYIHDRFTSFPEADFIAPVGGCIPAPGGICSGSAAGKQLPYTPTTSFNVGGEYKVEVPIGMLAFNADYFRSGSFFGAADNVAFQKAYDLVNASVSWSSHDANRSLKLFGRNLGNRLYDTSLIEGSQGEVVSRGMPRTYGVMASFKF